MSLYHTKCRMFFWAQREEKEKDLKLYTQKSAHIE